MLRQVIEPVGWGGTVLAHCIVAVFTYLRKCGPVVSWSMLASSAAIPETLDQKIKS